MKEDSKKPQYIPVSSEALDRLEAAIDELYALMIERHKIIKEARLKQKFGFDERERVN